MIDIAVYIDTPWHPCAATEVFFFRQGLFSSFRRNAWLFLYMVVWQWLPPRHTPSESFQESAGMRTRHLGQPSLGRPPRRVRVERSPRGRSLLSSCGGQVRRVPSKPCKTNDMRER